MEFDFSYSKPGKSFTQWISFQVMESHGTKGVLISLNKIDAGYMAWTAIIKQLADKKANALQVLAFKT
jgi:hypothetical protein